MSVFISGEYNIFEEEAKAMLEVSKSISIKPMLEVEMIPSIEDRIRAIKIYDNLGYVWIKNSSGAPSIGNPANPEVIKLLRENVRPECKVKASGNVNSFKKMVALFDAGAELVGTSHGLQILKRKEAIDSGY
jgi:deoxyribose-phosphate aldolase